MYLFKMRKLFANYLILSREKNLCVILNTPGLYLVDSIIKTLKYYKPYLLVWLMNEIEKKLMLFNYYLPTCGIELIMLCNII